MDGEFTIEVQGMDALLAALHNAPQIVAPIIYRALLASSALLAKYTTRDTVPWHTGNLVHSFRQEVTAQMARWFPTAAYAPSVEYGSSAHFPPYSDPGFSKWALDHGIDPFVLARSISKKGTQPHPFMQRILDNASPEIGGIFVTALGQIADTMAAA